MAADLLQQVLELLRIKTLALTKQQTRKMA